MTNEKMNFMELGMDDLEIVSGGTVREFDDLVYEFVQIPVLADLSAQPSDMFPVQTTLQHMQLN